MLFSREGWYTFISANPYLQVFHPKFEIYTKTIGKLELTSDLVSNHPFPTTAYLHNIKSLI